MKVCTDSCLFGAWTADRLNHAEKILDIGSGTGLLTLMLAQKNPGRYDAIELDESTFDQSVENIKASPWSASINPIEGDVRTHNFNDHYDFIISNPPFFESQLRSPHPPKNRARHDESLTLEALVPIIRRLLKPTGVFSILLPFHRMKYFEELAMSNGFFLQEKLLIRQTPVHGPFRSVLLFAGTEPSSVSTQELSIRDKKGNETAELLQMLEDYYLREN